MVVLDTGPYTNSSTSCSREVEMTANPPELIESMNHRTDDDGNVVVDLYDANQGKLPRTGGPYRDDIEKEQAEIQRAKLEGREPNLDDPPASAGTVLVPASQLVERDTNVSHFSDTLAIKNEPVASYVADTTDPFKGDPDPTQPNWDNDMSRVAALDAGLKMEELREKANKADPEPTDEDFLSGSTPHEVTDDNV